MLRLYGGQPGGVLVDTYFDDICVQPLKRAPSPTRIAAYHRLSPALLHRIKEMHTWHRSANDWIQGAGGNGFWDARYACDRNEERAEL